MQLFPHAQKELTRSNFDRKHPFRLFQLATFGEYPEIRTVVKREIDDQLHLYFYTDIRTAKVRQIKANNCVSAHFWHPKKQLQVRMYGAAHIISEGVLFEQHLRKAKQQQSMNDYQSSLTPGSVLKDEELVEYGDEIFFALVEVYPLRFDILQLSQRGHQRSECRQSEGEWQEFPIVP